MIPLSRRTARRTAAVIAVGGLAAGIAVFGSAQAQTTTPGAAGASTLQASTLREAGAQSGTFVGTAINDGLLSNATYRDIAATEFSSVTAENVMKWESIQPSRGSFNFAAGDRLVDFANDNLQQVWGHTLVWHSQLPDWVEFGGLNATELNQVMNDHISTVAGHYAGEIAYWDVVNEAFNEDGSRRQSVFQTTLGDGYIADAFRAAEAADPFAKLCINDYNIEGVNAKSDGMYRLVSSLLEQGVPIDCVGIQSHLILDQIPGSFRQNLERFTALGLEVVITELDIRISMPADSAELQRQATQYNQITRMCVEVSGCSGVTIWGISDRDSWVPDVFPGEGAACVWDENYQPKPAYTGMLNALNDGADGGTSGGSGDVDGGDVGGGDVGGDSGGEPPADCTVDYAVTSRWDSGSVVNVTVGTSSALSGWTVTFDLPSGSVVNGWNASYSQSGSTVTATNASYNSTVSAGGSFSFGFQTDSGAEYGAPLVRLNGTDCAPA